MVLPPGRFEYAPITERPMIRWPGNARVAFWVAEWSLEIMAAFIRAAYGKGYCDALTEESPGSLCVDHGYRMPDRRFSECDPAERAA